MRFTAATFRYAKVQEELVIAGGPTSGDPIRALNQRQRVAYRRRRAPDPLIAHHAPDLLGRH
jgi:hypothetical protein